MANKKLGGKTIGVGLAAAITLILGGVLNLEGGFVDNKNDPGGKTNHGITEAVARDHGYKGDMRDLTQDQALDIYAKDYVMGPGFDSIVELSAAVGEELIDSGVNAGTGRSARWFQTSLNHLNSAGGCPILQVDGKIGPMTYDAYQCLQRTRGAQRACRLTIKLMDAQQARHYTGLVEANPRFQTFIVGWVDHRIGNVDLNKC